MSYLSNKTLALFFTHGNSLEYWDKVGNLSRELALYKELSQHFSKIYFFTYGSEADLEYRKLLPENIEIVPKKINIPSPLYMLLMPFLYFSKLKSIDIYKTNQIKGGIAAVIAKKLHKKKLVARGGYEWLSFARQQDVPKWKLAVIRAMEKATYKNADKIIISYQYGKDFIVKELGISEDEIVINPNYIDTELFRPMPEIKKEKGRIICVAKLHPQKNIGNLIRAVSPVRGSLPRAGASSNGVKLIIFGAGPLENKLKKLAKDLNAPVEFKGKIANEKLPEEFNRSEIAVVPSYFEGNPKVLLEAMACGIPVIGTNVTGIKSVIHHKQNGYLAKTDVESLHGAIKNVFNDNNLREKIRKNARETIEENYSLQKVLETELSVYNNL